MFSIGDWMYSIFGTSAWGVLLCVFLIFFIDAVIFPAFPEFFFIIGIMYDPTSTAWGLQVLAVGVLAEVLGVGLLYWIVEHIRVPARIKNIAEKYVRFLIVNDEKMLLVNRIAPMIPFAGAFVSIIDDWKLSRALFYVALGGVIKYGVIMLMGNFFFTYFGGDEAQLYTIVFVIAVIIISFIAAYVRKKRSGLADENS